MIVVKSSSELVEADVEIVLATAKCTEEYEKTHCTTLTYSLKVANLLLFLVLFYISLQRVLYGIRELAGARFLV